MIHAIKRWFLVSLAIVKAETNVLINFLFGYGNEAKIQMDYDEDVKNKTTTSGEIDMKKRITITKTDEKLHFYLVTERGAPTYLLRDSPRESMITSVEAVLNVNCMNISSRTRILA